MTSVGRDAKAGIGKQYFFVNIYFKGKFLKNKKIQINGNGIDRDHCTIQNQNGCVTLIPRGEIRLNGKGISTPFVLQHGALICFGRNSTFRYWDPNSSQRTKLISKTNRKKSFVYSSAPSLSTKTNPMESGASYIQQKKISPANILDSRYRNTFSFA